MAEVAFVELPRHVVLLKCCVGYGFMLAKVHAVSAVACAIEVV